MTTARRASATTIVVGVDGSPSATAAVRWAAREARVRSADLLLVHAYNPMPAPLLAGPVPQQVFDDVRLAAQEVAEQAAEQVPTGVPVHAEALPGAPGPILEEASRDAALLVVGGTSRHSAAVRLALGSVAQHCVSHAHCPVVVVPAVPAPHLPSGHRRLSAVTA